MSKFLDPITDWALQELMDKPTKQLKIIKHHMEILTGEENIQLSQSDDDDGGSG